LVIALVPRVLLGWIAGALFQLFNKRMGRGLAAGLAAGIATFCHTVMVLGLIVVLFGAQYAQALGMAQNLLLGLMASVVLTNGIPELIAASLCCMALAKAIRVKQPAYSS
jgi:uncharacterized membrane protein